MKILITHNKYQQSGGEDTVVQEEIALLESHDHIVELYQVDNDNIFTLTHKIKVAYQSTYSQKSKKLFSSHIKKFQPQIVHVHNFFPILTPSIYDACVSVGIPVVQTLHNYRTICPGGILMRGGQVCEECINSSPFRAVLHRCYRNSTLGSLAVSRMVAYHRKRQTWRNKVNRFIALTEFGRSKFVEAGFLSEKIAVKPNFYKENEKRKRETGEGRSGALFVGRLSREKGAGTMMKAWGGLNIPLRIAGDGPLMNKIKESALFEVSILGKLSSAQVSQEMSNALFLIMPSEWYEGFPMTLVEAFSHGLPVVASRLGSMEEIVEDGTTGLLFEAGNVEDLAEKAIWMVEHPDECRQMGENARRIYEEKYTPENNYKMLMKIYQDVLSEK